MEPQISISCCNKDRRRNCLGIILAILLGLLLSTNFFTNDQSLSTPSSFFISSGTIILIDLKRSCGFLLKILYNSMFKLG